MSGYHSSAVIVARCLGVEGYSDYVHNQVRLYWKHHVMNKRKERNVADNEKRFKKLIADLDLSEKEKRILGRFISLRSQMSFDTGLRIGIQAFAHEHDKPVSALSRAESAPADGQTGGG